MAGIGNMRMIKLQKRVVAKDANGSLVNSISSSYKIWAEVGRDYGGREYSDSQTRLNARYTFKIYYNPDFVIDSNWKVIYDGKEFTVSSIERLNESRFNWIIKATADVYSQN